ncbi:unnamed protein product [Dovyalis caffra]|uniref:Uncharacterized protein n=1 Tax=Dovyalis caffra TaxID=77055 RepID=A0AAV1QT96_9ROSI|nr:unnamed protein product [Dovyalis caffra]
MAFALGDHQLMAGRMDELPIDIIKGDGVPEPEPVQLNQSGSRFKSVLPGESGASGSRNENRSEKSSSELEGLLIKPIGRSVVERLEASSAETANVADLDVASLAAH